jgi:hypothetical protein
LKNGLAHPRNWRSDNLREHYEEEEDDGVGEQERVHAFDDLV